MITKIKKIIFKKILNKKLNKLSIKALNKIYDLYDYAYLDDELNEINKEFRFRYINDLINNNINEFISQFGDFKTANMWINEPWKLGKYKNLC